MKKYIIIGGQYFACYYGEANTLTGAKRIAGKNAEYWDNWQGWHLPKIYRQEDVIDNGHWEKIVKCGARPVAVGYIKGGRNHWENLEN